MSQGLQLLQKLTGLGRIDPFGAFCFMVEIDGVWTAGFSQVSGLSATIDVDAKSEGGQNDFEYQLPSQVKYGDITLTKGYTLLSLYPGKSLWDWFKKVSEPPPAGGGLLGAIAGALGGGGGSHFRKNITIHLTDRNNVPVVSWEVYDAFPKSWEGPDFNANESAVAFENVVLAHHGFTRKPEDALKFAAAVALLKASDAVDMAAIQLGELL